MIPQGVYTIFDTPDMAKYHIAGPWPFLPDLHNMKRAGHGQPHDHPWNFRSYVVRGWYVEERFYQDGSTRLLRHNQYESFFVPSVCIHRIVEVSEEPCWTFAVPEEPISICWGVFEWRDGVAWKQNHDEPGQWHEHIW